MALVESDDIASIKEKLTITSTDHNPFTVRAYKEASGPNLIWVPRNLVLKNKKPIDQSSEWQTSFNVNFKLRPNQEPLVKAYFDSVVDEANYGGCIEAFTSCGKTNMAIYMSYLLELKTLVIVPTNTLLKQWKDRILEFTDCKEKDIGIIQQDRCEVKDKKIVIGMLHSLAMKDYEDYIYNSFGFVVVDELHRCASKVLSKAIFKFNSLYTLGLSATADRKNGMEDLVFWALGPIIARSNKKETKTTVYAIPYDNKDTHHSGCIGRYGKFRGKLISSKYLNKLELSKPRIEFVGKIIKKLYEKNENVLALSDRISILKNLKSYFIHCGLPEKDIGLFCDKYKETGRKIELASYGCAGLGYDREDIDTVVLVTSRVDIRQAIGRLRKDGKIIDIVDVRSDILKGWFYARMKHYNKLKCKVINKL